MPSETIDATAAADTCAIDSARRVAHVAHEAALLKSMVADTAETAAYAARRTITRGRRNIEHLRDAAEYRVRRAPLLAVGAAFAAGIGAAVLIGQCAHAFRKRAALKQS